MPAEVILAVQREKYCSCSDQIARVDPNLVMAAKGEDEGEEVGGERRLARDGARAALLEGC